MNAQQIQNCPGMPREQMASEFYRSAKRICKFKHYMAEFWVFLYTEICFYMQCSRMEGGRRGEGLCLLGIFPAREIYKEWIKNMVSGNELMHITS